LGGGKAANSCGVGNLEVIIDSREFLDNMYHFLGQGEVKLEMGYVGGIRVTTELTLGCGPPA
jgi:hypothetical protein